MLLNLKTVERYLIYIFIFILPFNLIVGRLFPPLVHLPLSILDIVIVMLALSLFAKKINHKLELSKEQRNIVLVFGLFILLALIEVVQHWTAIVSYIVEETIATVIHAVFKIPLGSEVLHSLNVLFYMGLSLVVFVAVVCSSLSRKKLLKIACIPLFLILVINIFLFVAQEDVKLDAGMPDSFILPYGVAETGRAYFPFVNSTLLSLYLGCFFFVLLYFFLLYH